MCIGSVGRAILAVTTASRRELSELCVGGCQHLLPRVRETLEKSQSPIVSLSLCYFLLHCLGSFKFYVMVNNL